MSQHPLRHDPLRDANQTGNQTTAQANAIRCLPFACWCALQVEYSDLLTAEERIAAVEAEVAALRAQRQELLAQAQMQQVQARLANATKDSHNSSKLLFSGPLAGLALLLARAAR